MSILCKDCKYFIPVDVMIGICKLTKKTETINELECDHNFEQIQKCKFCANYTQDKDKENIGLCMNKTSSYPEMVSKTCEWFTWK